MYSATFLIAVHPSSVTSSISHRSTVTSTWREVRTRASRRPSSSSVNRPQATTYGRDSGLPILSMTAMTGESSHLEARLHSRTIWGAPPPKVYSPESLQNAGFCRRFPVRRGLAARRRDGLLGLAATAWLRGSVLTTPRCAASRSGVDRHRGGGCARADLHAWLYRRVSQLIARRRTRTRRTPGGHRPAEGHRPTRRTGLRCAPRLDCPVHRTASDRTTTPG